MAETIELEERLRIETDTIKIDDIQPRGDQIMGFYCPINVLEFIFSFLEPKHLCICAQVNWYWNEISNQDYFWAVFLAREKKKWTRLSNQSSPIKKTGKREKVAKDATLEDQEPVELSAKEKYMEYQSASVLNKPKTSSGIIGKLFSGVTRRYKIALFGSGLEVPGSKRIAQSILNPLPGSMFTSNGFYSGNRGVGSGVCVRMADLYNLIVCFFYSNFREERNRRTVNEHYSSVLFTTQTEQPTQPATSNDNQQQGEQQELQTAGSASTPGQSAEPGPEVQSVENGAEVSDQNQGQVESSSMSGAIAQNPLDRNGEMSRSLEQDATGISQPPEGIAPQASTPPSSTVTVSPNVHDALRNMDALAYVVNSQLYSNWAELDKTDLHLLQSVCDEKVPLLIMSSIASADKERIVCADMIDILRLNDLKRPWLITDVIESSLAGVEEGFTWLCEKVGK